MDQIYAGMLTALDEGIGNITDTLKSTGMYDNSVMVLSNDNGGMSGSYGTARTTALVGNACWQQSAAASRHRIIVSYEYVTGCAARIRVGLGLRAGMGCCNCGTSCGGLNYPYRGWKDRSEHSDCHLAKVLCAF